MLLLLRKAAVTGLLAAVVSAQQSTVRQFTTLEHLDNDTVKLKGSGELLTFLATWVAPELAGYERITTGRAIQVRTRDGQRVWRYPEKMVIRVTIGNKTVLTDRRPLELDTELGADELAKSVHFRLRIYKGLEYRVVEPRSARMIGVPADRPYNERIYSIEFSLNNVPIEDRLMLEVLDPRDQRVARFSISML